MIYSGNLRKMKAQLGEVVHYELPVGETLIPLNELIGGRIVLEYRNRINCIRCGRETKTSFAQGYCYPCFISAPETEDCVLNPEKCRAHEGVARDMEYAREHCLIEHVVYLSVTSGLKVGVTRNTQVPVRWIDQGATSVIELARTPNRFTAGLIEVALKEHLDDKTNWRKMLSGHQEISSPLPEIKSEARKYFPESLMSYYIDDDRELSIRYPLEQYAGKISSLNLDKTPGVSGTLTGIKGQYLVFDNSTVINIRKFGGYLVDLTV